MSSLWALARDEAIGSAHSLCWMWDESHTIGTPATIFQMHYSIYNHHQASDSKHVTFHTHPSPSPFTAWTCTLWVTLTIIFHCSQRMCYFPVKLKRLFWKWPTLACRDLSGRILSWRRCVALPPTLLPRCSRLLVLRGTTRRWTVGAWESSSTSCEPGVFAYSWGRGEFPFPLAPKPHLPPPPKKSFFLTLMLNVFNSPLNDLCPLCGNVLVLFGSHRGFRLTMTLFYFH